jgi:hypothetical protein
MNTFRSGGASGISLPAVTGGRRAGFTIATNAI